MKAHSKTPKECLYLETGSMPIKFIIKQRRLMYWHHILSRENNELISRVYYAQKKKPIKDDWSLQVDKDAQDIGLKIDIQEIKLSLIHI